MAAANQLRLSFAGSEDGAAETETCRAAKLLWRKTNRTSSPQGPNLQKRRMRTRMYGGVAGESGRPLPLCRSCRCDPERGGKGREILHPLSRVQHDGERQRRTLARAALLLRDVAQGCVRLRGFSAKIRAARGAGQSVTKKAAGRKGQTVAASSNSRGKTSVQSAAMQTGATITSGGPVYQRLVLKLSGESLSGPQDFGLHKETIQGISHEVKEICDLGVQVAIVVGGGHFFRGTRQKELAIDRATGDYMGMLATVINGLAMVDALEKAGCHTRLLSAIEMHQVAEPFIRRRATRHLEKGRVVIFAAGTGNPYFSTDTAAALRAMEIKAQVILKATRVDGIYDADPEKVPSAKMFQHITYLDVLKKGLMVMDSTAISLCMDNKMPIIVFNMNVPGNLKRVVLGERVGSVVTAA